MATKPRCLRSEQAPLPMSDQGANSTLRTQTRPFHPFATAILVPHGSPKARLDLCGLMLAQTLLDLCVYTPTDSGRHPTDSMPTASGKRPTVRFTLLKTVVILSCCSKGGVCRPAELRTRHRLS